MMYFEDIQPGEVVGIGMEQDQTFEVLKINSIEGSTLTLATPHS